MEKPRDASELIGRYILWIVIMAIVWPFIGSIIVVIAIVAGNKNPSEMIIFFPYKYWWLSLSVIALIVWRRNIQYYFISEKNSVSVNSLNSSIEKTMEQAEKIEDGTSDGVYVCFHCSKKISFDDSKYSYGNKVVCASCLNKLKNKNTVPYGDLELNINADQISGVNFQYTNKEFIEFREKLINAQKKEQLVFSSDRWFIENYMPNKKVDKKVLNMFLDYKLDNAPDYLETETRGGIGVDKELMIEILSKSLRFNQIELAKEIKNKGKWELLVNFVKQNTAKTTEIASESERKKLQNILAKYGIIADENDLHLILVSIHSEIEYDIFKNKVKLKKPKSVTDYLDVFLEIYAENYQSHLGFLIDILYDNDLLNRIGLVKPLVEKRKEELEIELYEKKLTDKRVSEKKIDFASMSGHQFEFFLGDLFKKIGYKVVNTKLSGDQGADLIIEKFGEKIAVQAKNYSQPVSNSAVQEAVAAKNHYNCQKSMVVTTSGYTKGAISLAKSNNVELWDKERLLKEIKKYF